MAAAFLIACFLLHEGLYRQRLLQRLLERQRSQCYAENIAKVAQRHPPPYFILCGCWRYLEAAVAMPSLLGAAYEVLGTQAMAALAQQATRSSTWLVTGPRQHVPQEMLCAHDH